MYDVDGDLYFSVRSDPRFGEVSNLSDEEMLEVFGQRGGDPERPGKKDPLDCLLWQAERPGEPAWDTELGRGRPGLAHRVLGDLAAPPRRGVRRPGRRQRPGLPAPRDERLRGAVRLRRADVRAGLHARRHGRLPGREDVEVQGQPGAGVTAAAVGRRPDGDPAGPARAPLPLRLGVDRRRPGGRPRSAWPDGVRRSARRPGSRPRASSRPSGPPSRTTWTPRGPWGSSTPGQPASRGTALARRSCATCSTPASASPSEPGFPSTRRHGGQSSSVSRRLR